VAAKTGHGIPKHPRPTPKTYTTAEDVIAAIEQWSGISDPGEWDRLAEGLSCLHPTMQQQFGNAIVKVLEAGAANLEQGAYDERNYSFCRWCADVIRKCKPAYRFPLR